MRESRVADCAGGGAVQPQTVLILTIRCAVRESIRSKLQVFGGGVCRKAALGGLVVDNRSLVIYEVNVPL